MASVFLTPVPLSWRSFDSAAEFILSEAEGLKMPGQVRGCPAGGGEGGARGGEVDRVGDFPAVYHLLRLT